ncbi:GATOR complex protein NPRL3-like isoform X2 [Dreissena polymorpha]|uniref:GATOR complex protein NPRL3-like isoform X2 n=1 Tax=Dreissena polymorpha TaxID=45954 RepID=UPI00226509BE|nr:GATOR complex protein NPRL3-like isoform X2 [Dreissena polymorpha]
MTIDLIGSKMSEQNELLSILFVTSGSRGDRLLFKYPVEASSRASSGKGRARNPYAVQINKDFTKAKRRQSTSDSMLAGLSDTTLAHLLGVKSPLQCGEKFNVKIEKVRFVGFPLLLDDSADKASAVKSGHKINCFNIAFVLQAIHGPWVVSCYQDLAKQITVALKHEERRCQYLSTQAKIMATVHDEVASMPEDMMSSLYEIILQKSELAKQFQHIFESLNDQGLAHFYVNNWIEINFCLPYKLHSMQAGYRPFKKEPDAFKKCLKALRPYHGVLLLQDEQTLLDSLPVDCTPALTRFIQVASPMRSLQTLALEADLSLFQVFQLACHLVYWAKAFIIYPLCETNIFILSPTANTHVSSKLVEEFTQQFPGCSLPVQLAEFSFPTQLRDAHSPLSNHGDTELMVQIVVWMLKHQLLTQLHTYVFFVPPVQGQGHRHKMSEGSRSSSTPRLPFRQHEEYVGIFESGLQRSPSLSDAASVTSDESITLSTPGMLIAQMSKSPSTEFTGEGVTMPKSGDSKAYWLIQESVCSDLSVEEKECILRVPAAKNLDDLRMFTRLFPYFGGKNHIEEIMYFENLIRPQLVTLIEKFKEVLVLCTYEDSIS